MLKRLAIGTVAALAALGLVVPAAANARTLDEIIKSGVIKVGVQANQPPLSFIDTRSNWSGFDVDIANLLAEKLGVKAEFVPTDLPARVPNIVSGLIDISLGALTRTSDRMKVIDFTVPLHTENMAVLTTEKQKDKKSYMDFNDEKYTLVGCRGCTPAKFTQDNLPKAKLILVENAAEMVRSVAQGRADAVVANLEFQTEYMKNYPDVKWVILPQVIKTAYDAIGVQKGNYTLRDWLNAALWEIQSAGIHEQLWEKNFGMKAIVSVVPQYYR